LFAFFGNAEDWDRKQVGPAKFDALAGSRKADFREYEVGMLNYVPGIYRPIVFVRQEKFVLVVKRRSSDWLINCELRNSFF